MTNPNNAVGTNGAYGGRTSVNAFNDNLAVYSGRGILSGWACEPSSGMTVALGGDGEHRDVAIAEDPIGNRTTINNISETPVEVTIAAAPATNSRIDSIVAYVVRPPQGSASEVDNPSAVGLIAVSGTVAGSPTAPDDNAIRTAITADGAAGTTAYYVVLANITVANGTTVITSAEITNGPVATLNPASVDVDVMDNFSTSEEKVIGTWIDGKTLYRKTFTRSGAGNIDITALNADTAMVDFAHSFVYCTGLGNRWVSPIFTSIAAGDIGAYQASCYITNTKSAVVIENGANATLSTIVITVLYTKKD